MCHIAFRDDLDFSRGWLNVDSLSPHKGSHSAAGDRKNRRMPSVRVHNFAMSVDGYVAGPDQDVDHPLGVNGLRLHDWMWSTAHGRSLIGKAGGEAGIDNTWISQRAQGVGATIIGRNMFGPTRGPWEESDAWTGWWGGDPPFHHPVFVLTHFPHPSIEMHGGTTFHFVDSGIEAALDRALAAADGQDVVVGGGAATVRQYLSARLVDDLHLVIVPVLLGSGERLFENVGVDFNDYACVEHVSSSTVTHVRLRKVTAS